IEDANQLIQVMEEIAPISEFYTITYLRHPVLLTYVVQVSISKTQAIVFATDRKTAYVRKGAQNLPVDSLEKMRRLELDKGITSFEDEIVAESVIEDASEAEIYKVFCDYITPPTDRITWLTKQRLAKNDKLTVAGEMLFSDEPQICLPKRSSIKIFRYKTSGDADRATLDGLPLTIEGCAYNQIYSAVTKVKEIIESIKKLGKQFESIEYPEETLHEIITNAVLHRDYSLATDIQIRIFDNRVEIESPGKLPGYVTTENILDAQSARNPKIVRLVNKFPNAPNKDVGEGLNTAFQAMSRLRLKTPQITETPNSVLVIIRHEKLASPEEMVMQYMKTHSEITNSVGRELTGITSENTMKRVFWKLRDSGLLERIPGRNAAASAWRLTDKGILEASKLS
ncbi:MAG: ATP-binding protein, partial [Agathobaculum sp.]|uniref:ATP-binding protein n=1 Tax=Agathobaculum sp. TaxID=2048138 RepID=UPI003D90266C